MKKLLFFLLLLLILPLNNAYAISLKSTTNLTELAYTKNDQVSEISFKNNNLLMVGTTESPTLNWLGGSLSGQSDGFIASFAQTGSINWAARLGNEANEIAVSHVVDQDGSIWVLGATNTPTPGTQSSLPSTILNPDNVPLNQTPSVFSAINKVKVWQISNTGTVVNSFEYQMADVVLPTKIFVSESNITIFGNIFSKDNVSGFFITASKNGAFNNLVKIGVKSTKFNAAIKQSDGNFTVVGSSGDAISKSKPISKLDALTLRLSNTGVVKQVGRATLKNSTRQWNSIDSGLLQGGQVKYPKVMEAAITKFTDINKPVWNLRYTGKSSALVAAGKNSWATFISAGAIKGLTNWKPKVGSPVLLELGKKGELVNAYSLPAPAVAIDSDLEFGTFLVTDSGKGFGLVLVK